jgi:hypothetical protein
VDDGFHRSPLVPGCLKVLKYLFPRAVRPLSAILRMNSIASVVRRKTIGGLARIRSSGSIGKSGMTHYAEPRPKFQMGQEARPFNQLGIRAKTVSSRRFDSRRGSKQSSQQRSGSFFNMLFRCSQARRCAFRQTACSVERKATKPHFPKDR